MSSIHHAMTERFFGMPCIYDTMTKLPNHRVQKTPHMVLHIGYAPQKTKSHYHVVLWKLSYAPQKTVSQYHVVLWNLLLIPKSKVYETHSKESQ
jgi:hypothetical protein